MASSPNDASSWIVRLNAGALSPEDRHAYENWIVQDEGRKYEIESAQRAWRLARHLRGSRSTHEYLAGRKVTIGRLRRLRLRLRRTVSVMSPIGIAMIAIFLWTDHSSWKSGRLASETIAYTRVGEIQNYELPDQSQITIAGDSVVKVSFDPTRRELLLDRGEAFFDVQADSGLTGPH